MGIGWHLLCCRLMGGVACGWVSMSVWTRVLCVYTFVSLNARPLLCLCVRVWVGHASPWRIGYSTWVVIAFSFGTVLPLCLCELGWARCRVLLLQHAVHSVGATHDRQAAVLATSAFPTSDD
ncbi:hypothetical protein COO60DRAFT_1510816 [Scenedesmus sp. NREL 46B-D3]|nr:hypothetical protein COO60DRAFT_1510816 [Scenedesmus sp. NREL 46B-D3]